jgi:hypothetical protein
MSGSENLGVIFPLFHDHLSAKILYCAARARTILTNIYSLTSTARLDEFNYAATATSQSRNSCTSRRIRWGRSGVITK